MKKNKIKSRRRLAREKALSGGIVTARSRARRDPARRASLFIRLIPGGKNLSATWRGTLIQEIVVFTVFVFVGLGSTTAHAELVSQPEEMPIVYGYFQHELEIFGYAPWYMRNVPSFDSYNRPYIRSRRALDGDQTGSIHTLRDGRWVEMDFTQAIREKYPDFSGFNSGGGGYSPRIVFDAADHLYTVVQIQGGGGRNLLLYSTDFGESFQIYEFPAGIPDLEHWVGHNELQRPPLLLFYQHRDSHPAPFGSYSYMYVIQPEKQDGGLILPEPVLVTEDALANTAHSGHASFAVSAGDRAFFTWIEARPQEVAVPGAPTFVGTYNHATKTVGLNRFLVHAPPRDDRHNRSGIAIDSEGYLHVVSGAHGDHFFYMRSLEPYTVDAGWTEPELVIGGVTQTYLALLCDRDDTLHIVYRAGSGGRSPLFYQRRPAGGEWSEPTPLVLPAPTGYAAWYHKLALDRNGNLYLLYSYATNQAPYLGFDRIFQYASILMSPDSGDSWQLATSADFLAGIHEGAPRGGGGPGHIEGRILSPRDGSPVSGVKVFGMVGDFWKVGSTVTGSDGRFQMTDVYVDEIELFLEKPGYLTATYPLSLAGQSVVEADIEFGPCPDTFPCAPGRQIFISDDFEGYQDTVDMLNNSDWFHKAGTTSALATDPSDPNNNVARTAANNQHLGRAFEPLFPTDANPLFFQFDYYDEDAAGRQNAAIVTGAEGGTGAITDVIAVGHWDVTFIDGQNIALDPLKYHFRVKSGNIGTSNQGNIGWAELDANRVGGWVTFGVEIKESTFTVFINGVADPRATDIAHNHPSFNLITLGKHYPSGPRGHFDNVQLNLLLPGTTYAAWAAGFDLPAGLDGPEADASGDGIVNLQKFAFDLDPLEASRHGLPWIRTETVNGEAYLTLSVPRNPGATGEFTLEASEDLVLWDAADVVVLENSPEILRVRMARPFPERQRQFLRVTVSE